MPKLHLHCILLWVLLSSATVLRAQVPDTATLSLPHLLACPGDTVALPVTVQDFRDVRAFQFFLRWNAGQLQFLDTCHAYRPGLFVSPFAPNQLAVLLLGNSPDQNILNNLADGDTILTFKFRVLDVTDPAVVAFGQMPPTATSIVTTFTGPNGSALSYRPYVQAGSVSRRSLGIQADATAITCVAPSQLTGEAGEAGVSFTWFQGDVPYAAVADTLAGLGGPYTLVGRSGNCTDTLSLTVPYDTLAPPFTPIPAPVLNCALPEATLSPNDTVGGWAYLWTTPAQATTPGPTLTVTDGGAYTLQTTRPDNGCSRTDTVLVAADFASPQLSIATPDTLTCVVVEVPVVLTALDNTGFEVVWTDADGVLLATADTLWAALPGVYTATVTNPANGCTATATAQVLADEALPTVGILGDTALTCAAPTVMLTALAQPPTVAWDWRDDEGNALGQMPSLVHAEAGPLTLTVTDTLNGCVGLAQWLLVWDTLPPPLVLPLSSDTLTCAVQEVVLAVQDPLPGVGYVWLSEGDTLALAPVLPVSVAGLYTVSATDLGNGCTAALSLEVPQDTLPPTLTLLGDSVVTCAQPTVVLNLLADVPGACDWGGVGDACALSVSAAGSYTVVFTAAANGCTATATVAVAAENELPPLAISPPAILDCAVAAVLLQPDTLYAGWMYVWLDEDMDTLATSPTLEVSLPGTYTLAATDAATGCTAQTSVVVGQAVDVPTAMAAASGVLTCAVPSVALLADGLSPNAVFTWQMPDGSPANPAQVSLPGLYLLHLTDTLTQCTAVDTIEVLADLAPPMFAVSAPEGLLLTCARPTVMLVATAPDGVEWAWRNATGLLLGESPTLAVDEEGPYTLTATNAANGCVADTVLVVMADRTPPDVSISVVQGFDCTTGEAVLAATTLVGHTYQWAGPGLTGPDDTPQVVVLAPGTYTVMVTDPANGCATEAALLLPLHAGGIQSVAVQVTAVGCAGLEDGALVIQGVTGGQPPYTFALAGVGSIPAQGVSGLAEGAYTLVATDAAGCQWDSTFVVPGATVFSVAISPEAPAIALGDSVRLVALVGGGALALDWYTGGVLLCADCPALTVQPTRTTVYRVVGTDAAGCTAEALVTVTVSETLPVYVPSSFSPNGDGINDRFFPFVRPPVQGIRVFRVFNRWGGMVHEETDVPTGLAPVGWDGRVAGRPASTAVYVYLLEVVLADGAVVLLSGEVVLVR